jgi:hypothetical protein
MDSGVIKVRCSDRTGAHEYSVHLMHEFGVATPRLVPRKVADLWAEVSKHSVLFSDHTMGEVEPFLAVLFNSASVWMEVVRETDGQIVGVIYITHVIPRFDCKGHFIFFDGKARGRERIFHEVMQWIIDRYGLRRISCEAPPYEPGLLRFIERRLKMKLEGTKREAVLYKNEWYPLKMFGITRDEVADILVSYDQDVQNMNTSPENEDG